MYLQGDSRVGGPSSMRIVAGAVGRGEDAARARVALGVSVGRARARRGAGEEEGLVLLVGEHVQRQLLQIDLEVGVVVVRKVVLRGVHAVDEGDRSAGKQARMSRFHTCFGDIS